MFPIGKKILVTPRVINEVAYRFVCEDGSILNKNGAILLVNQRILDEARNGNLFLKHCTDEEIRDLSKVEKPKKKNKKKVDD